MDNLQGNFLTDSGSKIPLPKPKGSEASLKVPAKPNLAATIVKITDYTEQKMPKAVPSNPKMAPSRVGSVPNLTRQATGINRGNTNPPVLTRSKTNLTGQRQARILSHAVPSTSSSTAVKRNVPVVSSSSTGQLDDMGDGVTPAKVQKKIGKSFPYVAKSWELKLRLSECEQWLTDEQHKTQELANDLSIAKIELDRLRNVEVQYGIELERSRMLDVKLNDSISAFNKLDIDSRSFQNKINLLESEIARKKEENSKLENNLSQLRLTTLESDSEISRLKRLVDDLEYKYKRQTGTLENVGKMLNESKDDCANLRNQVLELENQVDNLKRRLQQVENENESQKKFIADYERNLDETRNKLHEVTKSLDMEKNNSKNLKTDLKKITEEKTQGDEEISRLKKENSELLVKLCDSEKFRRVLHNTVQDLKGNIRVFCRVRPALTSEKENQPLCSINYPDEGSIEISKYDPFTDNTANTQSAQRPKFTKHEFSFDRVFPPGASQAAIFNELEALVQSALDGYNVCIFAYGQTGSGKTYTMEGHSEPDKRGMIPLTVQHIFNTVADLKKIGWEYKVEVCFIEIYNETIRDLLQMDSSLSNAAGLKIMQVDTKTNDVVIPGLTVMSVESYDDLDRLYLLAHQSRVTASTAYNERSSRSHSVTKIKVTGKHSQRGETCYGSLNLVDLAGSERLHESMSSTDPRFREMKNINKSLSELGNVILSLYQKNEHIPYRNSKLTHLLQPALGGSSKTLMLVNISPVEVNLNETLCSLRFAKKVNEVKVGNTKKRITYEPK